MLRNKRAARPRGNVRKIIIEEAKGRAEGEGQKKEGGFGGVERESQELEKRVRTGLRCGGDMQQMGSERSQYEQDWQPRAADQCKERILLGEEMIQME